MSLILKVQTRTLMHTHHRSHNHILNHTHTHTQINIHTRTLAILTLQHSPSPSPLPSSSSSPISTITGRKVLVLTNLKARNLGGFKSEGMVLCASNAAHDVVKFVEVIAVASSYICTRTRTRTHTRTRTRA